MASWQSQNFYPLSNESKIQRRDLLKYPLLEILEKKLHMPVIKVRQVIEAGTPRPEYERPIGNYSDES